MPIQTILFWFSFVNVDDNYFANIKTKKLKAFYKGIKLIFIGFTLKNGSKTIICNKKEKRSLYNCPLKYAEKLTALNWISSLR